MNFILNFYCKEVMKLLCTVFSMQVTFANIIIQSTQKQQEMKRRKTFTFCIYKKKLIPMKMAVVCGSYMAVCNTLLYLSK